MDFRVIILVRDAKGGETAHITYQSTTNKGDAAVNALMDSVLKGIDINRASVHVTPTSSASVR